MVIRESVPCDPNPDKRTYEKIYHNKPKEVIKVGDSINDIGR